MGKCASKHHIDEAESSHFNFAGGNVHLVTSQEDWEGKLSEANREGKIALANFSASWCGPCKLITPYYAELSEKYPSLMFLLIDVDEMTGTITCILTALYHVGYKMTITKPIHTLQALCSKQRFETTNWEIDNLIVKAEIHFFESLLASFNLCFGYVTKVFVACPNIRSVLGQDKIARLYTHNLITLALMDLSTSYNIKATPSIFFLKNGEQIDKLVGCNKPELLKKITAILDSQPESSCLQPQPH